MPYVLYTDHLVILEQQSKPAFSHLIERLQATDPNELFVTIVSFHEQMQGWLSFLNKARSPAQKVMAYTELYEVGRAFFEMNILQFSDDAQDQFDALRKQRVRIATMDLRIDRFGPRRHSVDFECEGFRPSSGLEASRLDVADLRALSCTA